MISREEHIESILPIGCMVSCTSEVVLHHAKGGSISTAGFQTAASKKASYFLLIPLSPIYHTGEQGIHTIGVESWEKIYGKQLDMLREISEIIGYNVIKAARCGFTNGIL